jgi:hypothetical protein
LRGIQRAAAHAVCLSAAGAGRQELKTGQGGAEAGCYLIDGVTACVCGSIAEWRILAEYVAV